MKRLVVADANGIIVASGPHPDDLPKAAGEVGFFGITPPSGHHVHDVELPVHIKTVEQIMELHKSHFVKVESGLTKLVARG
jgi:phosphatidylethanolamine-binding protein (PEBP) family uncharacterized protein